MFSQKLADEFNAQIGREFYSGYFYMSMSAWLQDISLEGIAKWMQIQAQEEMSHAMIMYNFILDAGVKVKLPAIDQPPADFESPLDVFKQGLAHEKLITSCINNLMDIAVEEKNHAVTSFLNWFVDEQLEEEANFSTILGKLQLIQKSAGGGIFMLDNELGARTFVLPTPLTGKIDLGV